MTQRVLILLLIQLLSAIAAAQTTPPAAFSGPFVPFVTSSPATLSWISDSTPIRYGRTGQETETISYRMNHKILTGLTPGSLVRYEIPGIGAGQFTTPPAPGTAGVFTFVVFG